MESTGAQLALLDEIPGVKTMARSSRNVSKTLSLSGSLTIASAEMLGVEKMRLTRLQAFPTFDPFDSSMQITSG